MPLTDKQLKSKLNKFFDTVDPKIKEKFKNVVAKTRRNNIPTNIFLARTARYSRVLIPWKKVKNNNITFSQLQTFVGGVVVEFINEDWFEPINRTDPLFMQLKDCLGSDNTVSAIISFRSENGAISSSHPQSYFDRFLSGTPVTYKGNNYTITDANYLDFRLTQTDLGQVGNEKWSGFLYYSIKGGIHTTAASASNTDNFHLFNPSCDYANALVSYDIFFTLSYFALKSVDTTSLDVNELVTYNSLITLLTDRLQQANYDSPDYTGNLLDYCNNHPSLPIEHDYLFDPIKLEQINIHDFAVDDKKDPRNIDLTHNEAVFHERYYWDNIKQCILSPSRPTNLFWGFHESNMIQQNHTLEEYIELEISRVEKRLHITIDREGN